MKSVKSILLLVIGCSLLVSAAQAVPQYLNYQGVLRDSGGALISGSKTMTFRVYDDATAGAKKFEMTTSEVVSGGLYNVMLGPIGLAELAQGRRWLEVTVGTETLLPRIELVTVAYAISAATAEAANYAYQAGNAQTAVTATTATNATNATTATNANYATTAGDSSTVNGYTANILAAANVILPLDGNKQLKGMSVSAEAAGNTYGLFVNSGKIGANVLTNGCVGTSSIAAGQILSPSIANSSVTANSIIILTVGHAASVASANTNAGIRVTNVTPTTGFRVGTMDGNNASVLIPFSYLIIN